MPYILEGKICRPHEVNLLRTGDLIVVKPVTVFVRGRSQVFSPLSVISDECTHTITTPIWVDAVRVGDNVRMVEPVVEVEGELEILSHEFLPGFTARELLGKSRFKVASSPGVPIVTVRGYPLISSSGKEIYLSDDRTLLLALAHSLTYFLSSSE
ncbi:MULTISPECIES: hypothetical protein [Metallosphaera]|uniref:Uncharacterized protein n=3 Tax=Metallosphaera TaxID=41980 RepID=A4YHJ7_METS5|nr:MULTISPECIES: hypothetical protein [Metallosphaera]ABP95899.1 hypothetical protein Msed_1744 [Metallosphaera sedula DSM 5348]AIM27883.1 hypothetical protein HA72_1744 [Metallosphaera sedula]AKV74722.1 hypothetical protein MsedA_1779 [Metallosphaera sedula]AKV76960.1 hypothetical protein MsedB_1781 [Metallosphaera sedula]AKV79211.1 hypothetical protein MsedC_1779 [Metallosphaera sedula]